MGQIKADSGRERTEESTRKRIAEAHAVTPATRMSVMRTPAMWTPATRMSVTQTSATRTPITRTSATRMPVTRTSATRTPITPATVTRMSVMLMTILLTAVLPFSGCGKKVPESKYREWLLAAELEDRYTKEELYEAALKEGTLVVYSVSSRVFQAKDAFEREYPGLSVEVKDIRSNDVVDMLKENARTGNLSCDVVICSDCDGSLYEELIGPGIIYNYVPWDIAPRMKEGCAEPELEFLGEAMLVFYNTDVFDREPVTNIWELTEERYRGRIMMPNPLSSFSTYGFCAQVLKEDGQLLRAYEEYAGGTLAVPEGQTASMVFWEKLAGNLRFVNSNDEVMEGVGNSRDVWFGIMISSKLRYRSLGYHFAPITRLAPFSAVYTPNCISLAGGAENVNAAKLFIRYILGEADGTAPGAAAFTTQGAWSTRSDMPDGSTIPMEEIDMIRMDKAYLYENRERITEFFGGLLKDNIKH